MRYKFRKTQEWVNVHFEWTFPWRKLMRGIFYLSKGQSEVFFLVNFSDPPCWDAQWVRRELYHINTFTESKCSALIWKEYEKEARKREGEDEEQVLLENPCGFLIQGRNGFLLTVQNDTLRVCQDEECQVLLIVSAGVLFDLHTQRLFYRNVSSLSYTLGHMGTYTHVQFKMFCLYITFSSHH